MRELLLGIVIGLPIGAAAMLTLGICVDSSRREQAAIAAYLASYGGTDSDEDDYVKETA